MKRITIFNMFVFALCAIVGLGFIPLVARAQSPSEITIEIRAAIDGRSQLILRGNTAQWHHFDFAAPGRHLFTNFSTTINGVDWSPIWPNVPDAENRDCNCFSDVFTGVVPALPAQPMEIGLQILSVDRGNAQCEPTGTMAIVEFPSPDNNFTTIVEFDDNPQYGSAFYYVKLRIRTLPMTVQIDIKPWSKNNPIHYKGHGILPVAILSTEDLDAPSEIDQSSLTFGATGEEKSLAFCRRRPKDVRRDGSKDDLVCYFYIEAAGFKCGDTEGILNGKTMSGIPIEGEDLVKIVNCK